MDNELIKSEHSAIVTQQLSIAKDIQILSGNQLDEQESMLLASIYHSKMFKDADSLSKAITKSVFGKMMGMPITVSLSSLNIIDGKPTMEARAIRNTLVMNGYTINAKVSTNEKCVLEWVYDGKTLGESEFTMKDAMLRGYVDPSCYELEDFPNTHNEREVSKWVKGTKKTVTSCYCKDNWRSMPKEMLVARATTSGANAYGNTAFNSQHVYDTEEMIDSPFRDPEAVLDAREKIQNATTLQEIDDATKNLEPQEFSQLMELINQKSREIITDEESRSDTSKLSPAK